MAPFIIVMAIGTVWTVVMVISATIQDLKERKEERLAKANENI
jgi:hypothetical protein